MAVLITGIFRTRSSSMIAAEDLIRHGLAQEDISVQATDTTNGREFFTDITSKAPECGITGVIIGSIVGGVLASLCSLGSIPDPGLGLASLGTLFATLSGVGAGAIIGLIIGLLAGSTIPEYESNFYQVDRRNGGILVGVYCHERREGEVRRLLEASGGFRIHSKSVPTEPIRLHTTRVHAGANESTPKSPAEHVSERN